MATATNGNLVFVGASGRSYHVSFYTADTAAYACTLSAGTALAAAGGLQYWRAPEPVSLVDLSIPTGTTQTHGYMTQDGVPVAGSVMSYVCHVSTAATRPKLNIRFPAGALIGKVTI